MKDIEENNQVEISYSDTSLNGMIKNIKNVNKHNLSKPLIKDLYILIHVNYFNFSEFSNKKAFLNFRIYENLNSNLLHLNK